jgi:alpha-maltose-1-phosphate synthase
LGLSESNNIILYGFSHEDYVLTGAINRKCIKFYDIGRKFPKHKYLILRISSQLLFYLKILVISLNKNSYDIVHIQGHLPLFFLFMPMLKLRSKNVCWTLHDVKLRPSTLGLFGRIETFYLKAVTQPVILAKLVDSIIVHGNNLKDELSSMGIRKEKIHVLPHFDYQYLLDQSDAELKKDLMFKEYILLFGRIVPYKGFKVFVEAIRIAHNMTSTKFNVLISGKGDLNHLESILKEDDYNYITICPRYVPYARIHQLIGLAKFLVLPYTDASQSGIIPLAYTFSKPVIVSDVGSLSEYVEHGSTGYIFGVNDSAQLASYMVELIENDQKAEEMGRKAKLKLVSEMSLEYCCDKINAIYRRMRPAM